MIISIISVSLIVVFAGLCAVHSYFLILTLNNNSPPILRKTSSIGQSELQYPDLIICNQSPINISKLIEIDRERLVSETFLEYLHQLSSPLQDSPFPALNPSNIVLEKDNFNRLFLGANEQSLLDVLYDCSQTILSCSWTDANSTKCCDKVQYVATEHGICWQISLHQQTKTIGFHEPGAVHFQLTIEKENVYKNGQIELERGFAFYLMEQDGTLGATRFDLRANEHLELLLRLTVHNDTAMDMNSLPDNGNVTVVQCLVERIATECDCRALWQLATTTTPTTNLTNGSVPLCDYEQVASCVRPILSEWNVGRVTQASDDNGLSQSDIGTGATICAPGPKRITMEHRVVHSERRVSRYQGQAPFVTELSVAFGSLSVQHVHIMSTRHWMVTASYIAFCTAFWGLMAHLLIHCLQWIAGKKDGNKVGYARNGPFPAIEEQNVQVQTDPEE